MHPRLQQLHEQLLPENIFSRSEWGLGWVVSLTKGELVIERDDECFRGSQAYYLDHELSAVALSDFVAARSLGFADFSEHYDARLTGARYPGLLPACDGIRMVFDERAVVSYYEEAVGEETRRTLSPSLLAHTLGWYGRYGGDVVGAVPVQLPPSTHRGAREGVEAVEVIFTAWLVSEDLGEGGEIVTPRLFHRLVSPTALAPQDKDSFICLGEFYPLDVSGENRDTLDYITEEFPGTWAGFISPAFVSKLHLTPKDA